MLLCMCRQAVCTSTRTCSVRYTSAVKCTHRCKAKAHLQGRECVRHMLLRVCGQVLRALHLLQARLCAVIGKGQLVVNDCRVRRILQPSSLGQACITSCAEQQMSGSGKLALLERHGQPLPTPA